MEDLWPFNEPPVAEAIRKCSIPIISAVGHETDFSISDYVADLRAPTPSAAAELAVPERAALLASLSTLGNRLENALQNGIRSKKDRLKLRWSDAVQMRARRTLEQKRQQAEETYTAIAQAVLRMTEQQRNRLEREKERLFAYDPQRTLERGFALIKDRDGRLVTKIGQIETGNTVEIRFADGTAQADITGKGSI